MNTETLGACALAYNFFSRIFLHAPDPLLLDLLARERLFENWPMQPKTPEGVSGLALLADFFRSYTDAALPALNADYTALYAAPGEAIPLWESVWTTRDRLLFDGPMFDVRAAYAEYGLVSPRAAHEPDDHIGLELSFLGGVLNEAAGAADRQKPEEALSHLDVARNFLNSHLARWAGKFLQETTARAATPLYVGAALLCHDTLFETGALLQADSAHSL